MEKIIINSIEKKPSGLVIVKYNTDGVNIHEATLHTNWQGQEVDYLENDVGIGGSVSVLIKQKGEYTNITAVDFKSAEKGTVQVNVWDTETVTDKPKSLNDERSISIISQCMVKCSVSTMTEPIGVHTCVDMYKEAVKLLNE